MPDFSRECPRKNPNLVDLPSTVRQLSVRRCWGFGVLVEISPFPYFPISPSPHFCTLGFNCVQSADIFTARHPGKDDKTEFLQMFD
ncbi:MAG: hypothetical protein RLZZ143_2335 [Cyanobacteriota bacterium]